MANTSQLISMIVNLSPVTHSQLHDAAVAFVTTNPLSQRSLQSFLDIHLPAAAVKGDYDDICDVALVLLIVWT